MTPKAADEPVPQLLCHRTRPARAHSTPSDSKRTMATRMPALQFHDAYQLLIAVILSAQTTDVGVNKPTPALFERYPTPATLAQADQLDVEEFTEAPRLLSPESGRTSSARARFIVAEFGGEYRTRWRD